MGCLFAGYCLISAFSVRCPNSALFRSPLHHTASETGKWLYLRLDRPYCISWGTCFPLKSPTLGSFHPSDWLKCTNGPIFWPGFACFASFCVVPDRILPQNWSTMGFFSKSDLGPLGLPKSAFLARFEAHTGCFDAPYVPETLKRVPFWDQQGGCEEGQKQGFQKYSPSPLGMLVFLTCFMAVLDCFDTLYLSTAVETSKKYICACHSYGEWGNRTQNGVRGTRSNPKWLQISPQRNRTGPKCQATSPFSALS